MPYSSTGVDLFGATPFDAFSATIAPQPTQAAGDPFGMTAFSPSSQELDRQIANNDREMLELQASRLGGQTDSQFWGYD